MCLQSDCASRDIFGKARNQILSKKLSSVRGRFKKLIGLVAREDIPHLSSQVPLGKYAAAQAAGTVKARGIGQSGRECGVVLLNHLIKACKADAFQDPEQRGGVDALPNGLQGLRRHCLPAAQLSPC